MSRTVASDPHGEIQAALGGAYTLHRELPGGGIVRLFVCTETALGRQVVLKVLPSGLSAALNAERFRTDFGIAKALDAASVSTVDLTEPRLTVGTLTYVSPEQATGDWREVGE